MKIYFPYSSSSSSSSSSIILYYILDLKSTLSTLHLVIRLLTKNNRHKINIKSTQIDIKKGKPEDFPLKNNLTINKFFVFLTEKRFFSLSYKNSVTNHTNFFHSLFGFISSNSFLNSCCVVSTFLKVSLQSVFNSHHNFLYLICKLNKPKYKITSP